MLGRNLAPGTGLVIGHCAAADRASCDESQLLPNGAEGCSVGWHHLDPPEDARIHVCGATCETMVNDPGASLDRVFGCATGEMPPVY